MKCFTISANDIEGRVDPLYYTSDVFQIIKKSTFKIKTIGDIVIYIKTGFPAGADLQSHDENGIIQIRPTNINKDNLLYFNCILLRIKVLETILKLKYERQKESDTGKVYRR